MLKTYLFALVVGLQAAFGLNATVGYLDNHSVDFASRPSAATAQWETAGQQNSKDRDYLAAITDLGIKLHPGSEFDSGSVYNDQSEKHCASLVYRTFSVMPMETVSKVKNLTFYYNSKGRRGLGGGSTIILRCQNIADRELVSVLVHELGHIQDTGVMNGNFWAGKSSFMDGAAPVYLDDPSLEFYRISFLDESTRKSTATDSDFVTGYAKTDPFEDFAETYNFYLLQGPAFREMLEESQSLQKKYDFMREVVFAGQEFDYSLPLIGAVRPGNGLKNGRNYDSTVLEFDLKKFLANS
jgi:hypothetical protein